jgi:hypothetical protein
MEANKPNDITTMIDIVYYPDTDIIPYQNYPSGGFKFPVKALEALGISWKPLFSVIQTLIGGNAGKSGLYWVNTNGLDMYKFKDGSGFLGSLKTSPGTVGGGQARITALPLDPTNIFIAATLVHIEMKLEQIQEAQKRILEFLDEDKRSEMTGNLNFLSDVARRYKFNYENDDFRSTMLIKVQDIKQDSEQKISFYREQIKKLFERKRRLLKNKDINKQVNDILNQFKNYQQAVYLHAFSSFLDAMLLRNFSHDNLNNIAQKMRKNSLRYRELYTEAYHIIERLSDSTIQSLLLSGLADVNKAAGKAIEKVPVIERTPIDENLQLLGSRLEKISDRNTVKALKTLINCKDNYIIPFIEQVETLDMLYNDSPEVLIDHDNIYFVQAQ